jgi:hypothetical protein
MMGTHEDEQEDVEVPALVRAVSRFYAVDPDDAQVRPGWTFGVDDDMGLMWPVPDPDSDTWLVLVFDPHGEPLLYSVRPKDGMFHVEHLDPLVDPIVIDADGIQVKPV